MIKNQCGLPWVLALCAVLLSGCKPDGNGFGSIFAETGGGLGVAAVTITQRFPAADNVTVNFNEAETFFVAAVSQFPGALTYTWRLNSTTIQSGDNATYLFNGAGFAIGTYTLSVRVDDGQHNATASWTVKVNGPPVIESVSPTDSVIRRSYLATADFSVVASDPNNDVLTYTWRFDGDDSVLVNNGASAQLIPTEDMIGAHTVTVEVADDKLVTAWHFPVEINYFFNACNLLTPGDVCTGAGMISVGNTLNPMALPNDFRVQPTSVYFDSLGNMYLSEAVSAAIWYWNRGATPVTRLSVTVQPGTMRIVAGSGVAGFGGDGGPALAAQLNQPYDMVYDDVDDVLYIADFSNNRVRHVNEFGEIGTLGTHSTVGNQDCNGPMALQLREDRLWIACRNRHVIYSRVLRGPGIGTVTREVGTWNSLGNSAANLGDGGAPAAGRLNQPANIRFDPNGNLYIAEENGCRLRVWNREGGMISFGAVNVASGTLGTIGGSGTGNHCPNNVLHGVPVQNGVGALNRPRGLALDGFIGGQASIFYLGLLHNANNRGNVITAINYSGSAQTWGQTTVANGTMHPIAGTGIPGYTGENQDAILRRMQNAVCVVQDPTNNDLFFCDHANLRLRVIRDGTHTVQRAFGRGVARAVNGTTIVDATLPATDQLFGTPSSVAFDPTSRSLFFTNQTAHRVVEVKRFGQVGSVIGNANGGAALNEDELPNSALMNNPRALTMHGPYLVYADSNNHLVRVWNRTNQGATVLGTYVSAGRVATVAGQVASAGNTGLGGQGVDATLNSPGGVASDGTNLFIADTNNHCIKKLDENGIITAVAGVCGTAGNTDVDNQDALTIFLNNPENIATDSNGNLYVVDRTNRRIRFVNLNTSPSVMVGTRTILHGRMWTVACGGTVQGDDLSTVVVCGTAMYGVAVREGQFCFSDANNHNVRCVDTQTGQLQTVLGRPPANVRAGAPLHIEQEGISGADALVNSPRGVGFDDEGNLFVADGNNHLLRKVHLGPAPTP